MDTRTFSTVISFQTKHLLGAVLPAVRIVTFATYSHTVNAQLYQSIVVAKADKFLLDVGYRNLLKKACRAM